VENIIISQDRLNSLPVDGELTSVQTVEFNPDTVRNSDLGPAPNQTNPGEINGTTHSSVLLPDPNINIQKTVQGIVKDVVVILWTINLKYG
jgi:hypothetical protein